MCRAGYPVSRRAFHLGIVIFHISNRGSKNEIGVILSLSTPMWERLLVGTGRYWKVLVGTGGYWGECGMSWAMTCHVPK